MFKKILSCLLVVVILILLAIWAPWQQWNLNFIQLIGLKQDQDFATLKVKSLSGIVEIYVDGELQGSADASDTDFAEVAPVSTGEHLVVLHRKSENNKYYEVTRKINFEPGVDVVIAYDLGPNEYFSEGHILYSRKNYSGEQSPRLNIVTVPENCEVSLDGRVIGTAPLKDIQLDINSQHKLKFTKAGYDSMEINILPEDQEDRNKLKELTLSLEISLFAQPVKVNNSN